MTQRALTELVSRLASRRVAVIGDVMLDHFLIGRVDRISPEAPVPVVRFRRDEYQLGGAANVARNVAALGGRAELVGVVGDDEAAAELRGRLAETSIDGGALIADGGRPTTRKVRIVTERNQQVARVDYEADGDVSGPITAGLLAGIATASARADAVILSDYAKGVVTPASIEAAVRAAASAKVPVLADPKLPQASRYRGVTLITPNHREAEAMTQTAIRSIDDVRLAARKLHELTNANVLITWGENGMWVLDRSGATTLEEALPAAAREVSDVTGAGDTVIAVLALCLAAGSPLLDAARLANLAAGLVVAHFGPAAPTPDELRGAVSAAR